MALQKFDLRGERFHFYLYKYSCYRCKTGVCSLEDISLDELKNSLSHSHFISESSIEYYRDMAKLFLDGEISAPTRMYLNRECGNYSFPDGQLRTFVFGRVLQKGAEELLNVEIIELKQAENNYERHEFIYAFDD